MLVSLHEVHVRGLKVASPQPSVKRSQMLPSRFKLAGTCRAHAFCSVGTLRVQTFLQANAAAVGRWPKASASTVGLELEGGRAHPVPGWVAVALAAASKAQSGPQCRVSIGQDRTLSNGSIDLHVKNRGQVVGHHNGVAMQSHPLAF